MGPPNSLLSPPLRAYRTSKPNLTWFLPQFAESVSLAWYWRLISSADCDVPLVKVPPVEMGTTNCVLLFTGSNSVIGDASWNCSLTLLISLGLNTAVSPSSSENVCFLKVRATLGSEFPQTM